MGPELGQVFSGLFDAESLDLLRRRWCICVWKHNGVFTSRMLRLHIYARRVWKILSGSGVLFAASVLAKRLAAAGSKEKHCCAPVMNDYTIIKYLSPFSSSKTIPLPDLRSARHIHQVSFAFALFIQGVETTYKRSELPTRFSLFLTLPND